MKYRVETLFVLYMWVTAVFREKIKRKMNTFIQDIKYIAIHQRISQPNQQKFYLRYQDSKNGVPQGSLVMK